MNNDWVNLKKGRFVSAKLFGQTLVIPELNELGIKEFAYNLLF
jgi:hypothetical protein